MAVVPKFHLPNARQNLTNEHYSLLTLEFDTTTDATHTGTTTAIVVLTTLVSSVNQRSSRQTHHSSITGSTRLSSSDYHNPSQKYKIFSPLTINEVEVFNMVV
ncbi:Uncharacterized protein Fot_00812 [Forsythia ovata]|uniref:Uncharacterized protein n=1 Tax=Forsythia ovata TaxID=205694 RepID=A0ABD1X546_9LAMI